MKHIKNQNGYSLLIAIALVILFSLLGLSLMVLTTNGTTKNELRQDTVRSIDQADKGLDYALLDINKQLDNYIKAEKGGLTQDNFVSKLNTTLNVYKCNPTKTDNGRSLVGETGEFKVCIDSISPLIVDGIENPLKKLVTFKSLGISGDSSKVISSQVILGANAVPEQLKYAVSTNNNGNLYLHGGVDVQGDMKIDGNMIISKKAHWLSGSNPRWEASTFSKFTPLTTNVSSSKIFMRIDKNIYLANIDEFGYYYEYLGCKKTNGKTDSSIKESNCDRNKRVYSEKKSGHDYSEHIDYNFNQINVNSSYYTYKDKTKILAYQTLFHQKIPEIVVEEESRENDEIDISQKITDAEKNSNYGRDTSSTLSKLTVPNGKQALYVKNNVSITGNTNNKIEGIYFINGNLTIKNADLITDAIIYVNGTVSITESTINKDSKTAIPNGKFIIFSNRDISISNISVDKPEPSKVQGFFYSKDNFIMYGVGSNIKIFGGISAKRIILTAVRGSADNHTYLSESNQKDKTSRMQILYDSGLIDGFVKLNRETEEKVKVLAEPVIQSRTY